MAASDWGRLFFNKDLTEKIWWVYGFVLHLPYKQTKNTMNLSGIKNAWVTPYGKFITTHPKFYGESAGWHNKLAELLVADETNIHDYFDLTDFIKASGFDYAYEYLESVGWLRLHGFGGMEPKFVKTKRKLTSEQEGAILDWCSANNVKYSDCFSK